MYKCFVCNNLFERVNLLISHLKLIHNLTPYDKFVCMQNSCPQIFFNINSYKRHLNNHSCDEKPSLNDCQLNCSVNNIEQLPKVSTDLNQTTINDEFNLNNFESIFKKSSLAFMCKLHSENNLSRKIVNEICLDVVDNITSLISDVLEKLVINNFGDLKDTLRSLISIIKNPFEDFSSEYKLLKALEHRNLVVPPKQLIPHNELNIIVREGNALIDAQISKGILMPLKFQLQTFFELPHVYERTIQNMESIKCSSYLENFINGRLWKKKILRC